MVVIKKTKIKINLIDKIDIDDEANNRRIANLVFIITIITIVYNN